MTPTVNRLLVVAALALFCAQAQAQTCSKTSPGSCVQQDDGIQRETPTLGENGGTGGSLTFNGATSGSVTITPNAVAGTGVTLTLPASSGTVITTAGGQSIAGLTVTGSFTATGLVTNADLVNASTTVNGATCTLGATCTAPAAAGTLTGSTLNSGVTASSLTSVGTLAGLTVTGSLTATGLVTNADLANASANSVKCNNTGVSATPIDCTTAQAQQLLLTQSPPQGRLTLATGTPVMTSSVTGSTTVYYTPYHGRFVPIYNGTSFVMTDTGGEISQATTDTTKSPAAVAVSSCYDVFVWNDGGIIRATRGPAWTNTTTRSAGTALTLIQGYNVNSTAITNGPGTNLGTYVGTFCSNGTSTVDFIFGASSAGGTASSLNIWNAYNRVTVSTTVTDSTTAYTYSSSTIRVADNSSTMRVTYTLGLAEEGATAIRNQMAQTAAASGARCAAGIGLNSTAAFAYGGTAQGAFNSTAAVVQNGYFNIDLVVQPTLGQSFVQALEQGDGTNLCTYNSIASFGVVSQLSAVLRM